MPWGLRRHRSRVGAVLMLLLVLLAGCEGAFGGLDVGQSRSTTPTASSVEINAPGFSGTNVTHTDALLRAHTDSLTDRSYTARSTVTVRHPNGSVRGRRTVVIRVDDERDRFRFTHRLDGRLPWPAIEGVKDAVVDTQTRHIPPDVSRTAPVSRPIEGYGNANGTFLAIDRTSGRTYHQYPTDLQPPTTGAFELHTIVAASLGNLTLTSVTQDRVDGWSAYRIVGGGSDGARVSATIGSFGLIYNLTVVRSLPAQYGGGTLEYHVSYTAIDDTTVDRPAWMRQFDGETTATQETTEPTTTSDSQVLSGHSENVLENTATRTVSLAPGYAIFNIDHEGTGRIAIWLFNRSTRQRLLLNTTGSYQGTIATNIDPGDHRLRIQADGRWEITVRNGTAPPTSAVGPTQNGSNLSYVGPFPGDELHVRFLGVDRGVDYRSWVVAESGRYRDYFTQGVGPLDTTRRRPRLPGVFYIGIRTTGDWVIQIRPVTR